MAATDNDALLKAMDQLMKEEDRASVIEYAKQLSTKGGDVVGTMRKMSQQGVDTRKDAAMWKKRALLTAAAAVVVCAVMFGLMVASAEVTKEFHVVTPNDAGSGRRLTDEAPATEAQAVAVVKGRVVVTADSDKLMSQQEVAVNLNLDGTRRLTDEKYNDPTVMIAQISGVITTYGRRLDDDGRELVRSTSATFDTISSSSLESETGVDDGNRQLQNVGSGAVFRTPSGGCYYEPQGTYSATCDFATAARSLSGTVDRKYVGKCQCKDEDPNDPDACIKKDNTVQCL